MSSLVRFSALRSFYHFHFNKYVNIVRQSSNLADSQFSSDEESILSSQNKDKFENSMIHPDTLEVLNVLRTFRRQPKQALSFFYGSKNAGFQHNIQTYAEIVRILCRRDNHVRLERMISEVVKLSEQTSGFGIPKLFQALVKNIEGDGQLYQLDFFSNALVRCCAKLGFFEDAVHVLFETVKRGFPPSTKSSNFLMKCLINSQMADLALTLYQHLKTSGLTPTLYTYNLLIEAHFGRGRLEEALEVVHEMEGAGINPNEFTYYTLIRGFCNEMKLSEAEGVFRYVERKVLIPGAYCFSSLIDLCRKTGKFNKALALYDEMLYKGVKPTSAIIGFISACLCYDGRSSEVVGLKNSGVSFDAMSYNLAMDSLCKSGEVEEAKMLFNDIRDPDLLHHTTLINGYCREGKIVQAQNVFAEMQRKGLKPDVVLYNILLGAFCRNGYEKEAMNPRSLMQPHGLRPNAFTHKAIIEGLCVTGKVKEAEVYFNGLDLEEKSMEVYSAMVYGYSDANHTTKASELSYNLSQQGILVNKKSQFKLLSKLLEGREIDTHTVFTLYRKFMALEKDPCLKTCSTLISRLCKTGDDKTARLVFRLGVGRGLIPNVFVYTNMIKYCRKSGELHALWARMMKEKLEPDLVCYIVLVDKLGQFNDLDGAFQFFREIMARGLQPNLVAYNTLLYGCFRNGDVDRALVVVGMLKEIGLIDDMRKDDIRGVDTFFDVLGRGVKHISRHHHGGLLCSAGHCKRYEALLTAISEIISVTQEPFSLFTPLW